MAGVKTPISQALAEGILSREQLRQLMQRSDTDAFSRLWVWLGLFTVTSYAISQLQWSFGGWLAMFIHGVMLVHLFALQHECAHYTVFKTRWLNQVVGSLCGFIVLVPNRHFRYEHCDHHTFTNIKVKDPELIPLPRTLWGYYWYISAFPYWYYRLKGLLLQSLGKLSPSELKFIPKTEQPAVCKAARLMLLSYASLALATWLISWNGLLLYWLIPLLLGEPVMRFIRMTEHVGLPNIEDMKRNTRTTLVSWPWRFLCWNMNYHAAHHYASSVPYHALPRLHALLADHVHTEAGGYIGAHQHIFAQLMRKIPRSDEVDNER